MKCCIIILVLCALLFQHGVGKKLKQDKKKRKGKEEKGKEKDPLFVNGKDPLFVPETRDENFPDDLLNLDHGERNTMVSLEDVWDSVNSWWDGKTSYYGEKDGKPIMVHDDADIWNHDDIWDNDIWDNVILWDKDITWDHNNWDKEHDNNWGNYEDWSQDGTGNSWDFKKEHESESWEGDKPGYGHGNDQSGTWDTEKEYWNLGMEPDTGVGGSYYLDNDGDNFPNLVYKNSDGFTAEEYAAYMDAIMIERPRPYVPDATEVIIITDSPPIPAYANNNTADNIPIMMTIIELMSSNTHTPEDDYSIAALKELMEAITMADAFFQGGDRSWICNVITGTSMSRMVKKILKSDEDRMLVYLEEDATYPAGDGIGEDIPGDSNQPDPQLQDHTEGFAIIDHSTSDVFEYAVVYASDSPGSGFADEPIRVREPRLLQPIIFPLAGVEVLGNDVGSELGMSGDEKTVVPETLLPETLIPDISVPEKEAETDEKSAATILEEVAGELQRRAAEREANGIMYRRMFFSFLGKMCDLELVPPVPQVKTVRELSDRFENETVGKFSLV